MMDWFRLYGEFATDPKVQMMPECMQRRLVMLFCLQCSHGIETVHETEREKSIAFALRISEAEVAETKALFLRKGFIHSNWTLCNWDKRQYTSDSSTARVRRYRAGIRQEREQHETLGKRSSNALEQNRTETEAETTSSDQSGDETLQSSYLVQANQALAYLNAKTHSAFRPVPANLDLIRARLREGYSLDVLKSVMDAKTREWIGDAKMQKFLRPATLFNRTNFSQYAGVVQTPTVEQWWHAAGFPSRYEAESAGCTERNCHSWRGRERQPKVL